MQYLGDYKEDDTVQFKWSTNDGDGASITRSTDGTIHVYKDGATAESTAGITDVEDFDGLTGIHHCRIELTDVFYVTGADYQVVLKAATIDTQTVNAVLAHFSIENRFMRGTDNVVLAGATKAEMDTAHALLATPAQVATELGTYDSPTKEELDSGLAGLNDITVANIIAGIVDGSYDLQEMMRIIFAACALKSSGGGTTAVKFRDSADGKDRISAIVDSDGNRTAVTLDGS